MKITKSVLRKIILEEFAKVQEVDGVAGTTYTPGTPGEEPEAETEPAEKQKTDVAVVIKYIDKIADPVEYAQLVQAILQHQVPSKSRALRQVLGSGVANVVMKKFGGE